MSSKGSPRVTVRIPEPLLVEIGDAITRRNEYSRGVPWDLTAFLLVAVREKLDKMARSRRHAERRSRKQKGQQKVVADR